MRRMATTFATMDRARDVLRVTFGFPEFRPLQEEIVRTLIEGGDAFVLMPTGGGKSLCFQIPSIVRPGVGIVVSPLISLMKDQVDGLRAAGVRAARYDSSQGGVDARRALGAFHGGDLDVLYVSPERLLSDSFMARLAEVRIALFAIDEAHCVSRWGHDFRPEYVQLGGLRERFPDVPLVALTATADPQTRLDIVRSLRLEGARRFVASFDRPNIHYAVVPKKKPEEQIARFLAERPDESGIVYCLSRKRVDEVSAGLRRRGVAAGAYHAGLSADVRQRAQDAFLADELRVMVATVAFGMGIDKTNVRFVVHHDLPTSVEGYYQETGRAGRDGLPARALLLLSPADIVLGQRLLEQTANVEQRRIESAKLRSMAAYAESDTCRRRILLGYFGEERLEDCGRCDVCENPPARVDATVQARKALSCVFRVGQSFGVNYVADVLVGSSQEKILARGHDRVSTWGIGKEWNRDRWLYLLRQLVHRGYLEQDLANWSVLRLTEKARGLLAGREEFRMAVPIDKGARGRNRGGRAAALPAEDAGDTPLFDRLRAVRRRLATEESVPAYVIFSDATLREMARRKPVDATTLLEVPGVGQYKLDRYGPAFLEAIRERPA